MRLSQFSDYALRVLMYSAVNPARDCQIAEIATCHNISRNHLVKVVNHLSRAGFLVTKRGRGGGIHLGRSAQDILVGDVIRSTENCPDLRDPTGDGKNQSYQDAVRKLKGIFKEAHGAFLSSLDHYNIAELVAEEEKAPAAPAPAAKAERTKKAS